MGLAYTSLNCLWIWLAVIVQLKHAVFCSRNWRIWPRLVSRERLGLIDRVLWWWCGFAVISLWFVIGDRGLNLRWSSHSFPHLQFQYFSDCRTTICGRPTSRRRRRTKRTISSDTPVDGRPKRRELTVIVDYHWLASDLTVQLLLAHLIPLWSWVCFCFCTCGHTTTTSELVVKMKYRSKMISW